MKTLFWSLLFSSAPLLADPTLSLPVGAPPNRYDTNAGQKSPMFSAASAEASHWMTLLDQAQYGPSWLDAGPIFRDVITQEQWIAAMRTIRRPLGVVKARKISDHRAVQVLPNGTQGYFMIIRYSTDFSSKSGATETVTLMMIQNDQWRAISYSVQ